MMICRIFFTVRCKCCMAAIIMFVGFCPRASSSATIFSLFFVGRCWGSICKELLLWAGYA